MLGVTKQTLRDWDKAGKLKPYKVAESGYRYYSEEQYNSHFNIKRPHVERIVIGYCRVSSNKQKDDLKRQIDSVKTYMIAKGYRFDTVTDIGSGINYNNKGLMRLLEMVVANKVEKIVILYKDRLVRFGFELIVNMCKQYGTEIEIIDATEKNQEQELVEDLIQIVTVFSCRLQGKRANKARKMIKEMQSDFFLEQKEV